MGFIPVKHIFKWIIPLHPVPEDPSFQFPDVIGMDIYFQIHLVADLLEIKDEQTLHNDHRCRLKGEQSRLCFFIIIGVLPPRNRFPCFQPGDILGKRFGVDGSGEVKILVSLAICELLVPGEVIVILRNDAQFFRRKAFSHLADEACLSGTTSACDPDYERHFLIHQ